MKTHLIETIKDIDQRIERLTLLRAGVIALNGEVGPASVAAAAPPKRAKVGPSRAQSKPRIATRAKNGNGKPGSGGHKTELLLQNLAAISKLPQPFSASDIARATGKVNGTSVAGHLIEAGYLRKIGHGSYELTGKSGGAAPAEKRVAIPGLDDGAESLTEQLEKALKARDDARAKGQDRLAAILQDKVPKLEAAIGS